MKLISLLTDGTFNVNINNEYIWERISSSFLLVISASSIFELLIVVVTDDDGWMFDEIGLVSMDDFISCSNFLSNNECLSFSSTDSGDENKLFLIGFVSKAEDGLHEEISNVLTRFWPF